MKVLKWIFKIWGNALNKPLVIGSLKSEETTHEMPIEYKTDWKYICPKCGKGNNDTILAAIHIDYCHGNNL